MVWHAGDCGVCVAAWKDVEMVIRKSTVVSFQPSLVTFFPKGVQSVDIDSLLYSCIANTPSIRLWIVLYPVSTIIWYTGCIQAQCCKSSIANTDERMPAKF